MLFKESFIPWILNIEPGSWFCVPIDRLMLMKWQTRRVVKSNESMSCFEGICSVETFVDEPGTRIKSRLKWQVGKDYAVQAGRGLPCVMVSPELDPFFDLYCISNRFLHVETFTRFKMRDALERKAELERQSWYELRIVLKYIGRENLQDITMDDCFSEGAHYNDFLRSNDCASIRDDLFYDFYDEDEEVVKHEFSLLWDSINTKKGTRWKDNPNVWVLSFVRER